MDTTTRPPTPDPRATDPGRGVGAFLDRSGSVLGRTAESADHLTEKAVRLAAEQLVDQATRPARKPGIVIRLGRALFGLGRPTRVRRPRPAKPTPQPKPTRSGDLAPMPTWMRWLGVWFRRTVGALPLLAPLAISGWYTVHVGIDKTALGLPLAVAVTLSLALEGGVWKLVDLYEKTLVAGDSTISLRLGLFGYITAIGGLIFWHATRTAGGLDKANWRPALVVSCMSLAGMYIKAKVARWQRRSELRAAGRVDTQLVRFSIWSWLLAPLETAAALRYAVKRRIDKPVEAMESYRADRDLRRADRAHSRAARRAEKQSERSGKKRPTPTPDPTPAKKPTRAKADQPTPTPAASDPRPVEPTTDPVPTADPESAIDRPTKPTRSAARKPTPTGRAALQAVDDAPILTDLRDQYPTEVPSLKKIQVVAKKHSPTNTCSKDKAIRLQKLYRTEIEKTA